MQLNVDVCADSLTKSKIDFTQIQGYDFFVNQDSMIISIVNINHTDFRLKHGFQQKAVMLNQVHAERLAGGGDFSQMTSTLLYKVERRMDYTAKACSKLK